jgi:hypothetical protein
MPVAHARVIVSRKTLAFTGQSKKAGGKRLAVGTKREASLSVGRLAYK